MLTRCSGLPFLFAAMLGGCAARSPASPQAPPTITALSTRPHLVSGGDVLLRIDGEDLAGLRVEVRGEEVTARFRPSPDGSLIGLLKGLPEGESVVRASAAGAEALLPLTVWPITGPIISGPHQRPFLCTTGFALVTGDTLAAATDPLCSVETRVDYVYRSTTGGFQPLPGDGSRPSDLASTTTLDGALVPFIVRVQTGTVNRAIYESAMLHDPADPAPDPWNRSRGWNGKLVFTHGGGCRAGWHVQGERTGGVLNEGLLAMGFATTSSTLNVFGQNCNDLLASETHIMVKERFIESYGQPEYTVALGGSGGAYQSHQTADNYPGVFDGIVVTASFPDVLATIGVAADARLLHRYFTQVAPDLFTREQQRLVSGFGVWESIAEMSRAATRIDPTFDPDAPPEAQGGEVRLPALEGMRYSASNPEGIRASVYDHTINVYGVDEQTGFAARPLDNHGVQYGLAALQRGEITPAQFIALNRGIGGFDADLNHVAERHRAHPRAAERASGTGRILHGGGGLAGIPIIDYRSYQDHAANGDVHMIVHQHATRARLEAANGQARNQVMMVGGRWGFTEESPDLGVIFRGLDRWIAAIRNDTVTSDPTERVVRTKPADLQEGCWEGAGADRVFHRETLRADGTGRCAALYPVYRTPRQVAGAPLANDAVSCRLKPVDPSDYPASLSAADLAAIREIFREGVCDWGAGDPHDHGYRGTWRSFGPSPVGLVR